MIIFITLLICILFNIVIYLLLDYNKIRIIKFRQVDKNFWQIAFNEKEMWEKLDGNLAEVIMPEKPLIIRWLRKLGIK